MSILGFISYAVYDFINEKEKKEKSLDEIVFSNVKDIGLALLNFGVLTFSIGSALMILEFLFFFLIKLPYSFGWKIVLDPDYFKFPSIIISNSTSIEFFICFISVLFYWILVLFSFIKLKDENYKSEEPTLKKINNFPKNTPFISKLFMLLVSFPSIIFEFFLYSKIPIKYYFRVYLIFITPTVFFWLYPVILNWCGALPVSPKLSDFLKNEKLDFIEGFNFIDQKFEGFNFIDQKFVILSYVFLAGLFLLIIKIIKHNNKVNRELLKEEIKKEVMDEFNKSQ